MTRTLRGFIGGEPVGTLYENQGIWSFRYEESWVAHGVPLSPGLPLTPTLIEDDGSVRPVQWFFDNLLPEGDARARLIASLPGDAGDAWDLLAQFGAESAGALTLLPPGMAQAEAGLRPLSDEELNARILAMPRQSLASKAPKKMSLAGAQEKLPVVIDERGAVFDPIGATASTHILKPDVLAVHYPASSANEWYCARLARELKLPVPPVALRYVPASVYIIERFDRRAHGDATVRLHTLDAAQLLSLDAGAKYTKSGAEALRAVAEMCRAKAPARIALFRWALFNALIGNGDAHLKNLSLFAEREGYSLAPHYDLVSTGAWCRPELLGQGEPAWPDIGLSFPIGNARTFAELTRSDFFLFAEELGVPTVAAERSLHAMTDALLPAADSLRREYESRNDIPAAVRTGQMRMLLAILHLPLRTMQGKLT